MQATIFAISIAPYLQHVLHSTMFSTCQGWHHTCHQHSTMLLQVQHSNMLSTCQFVISIAPCPAWQHVYHLSSMAPYWPSSNTPRLLHVNHGTVYIICQASHYTCQVTRIAQHLPTCQAWHAPYFVINQDTLSTTCQAEHPVY
jgi:hypothetical protein